MTTSTDAVVWEEVSSPFCGIASDDLTVQVTGTTVKVVENGDAVTIKGFETPISDTSPRINGKDVSLDEAVNHIATVLRDSKQPVISGMATDVNGARHH
jgi:formylmethanofuran dehydrogenase subunit B